MPTLMTKDFKDKEFYFDLRPDGTGDLDGFWAAPIFESVRQEIVRKAEANGKGNAAWVEMLVYSMKNWQGFKDVEGTVIPFSEQNIRGLCEADPTAMLGMLSLIQDAARARVYIETKN